MEICIATLAFSLNLSYYLFSIYIRGNTKTSLCYSKLLISIIYFQERKIYLFNLSNQVKIIHFDKFLLTFINFFISKCLKCHWHVVKFSLIFVAKEFKCLNIFVFCC